jgi:DNA-directed RNA polymerase I subunit RPA1
LEYLYCYILVAVGENYLVPKDGTPILDLIQDHVVSGVLMTLRGRFFNKEDFMHLLLAAFGIPTSRIKIPKPAMLKPKKLWTGKQVGYLFGVIKTHFL